MQESALEVSKKQLLKGLLNAYSEVEQLLQLEKSLLAQQEAIQSAVNQSLDAYNLSKERYDRGVTILESVLNTQRQYNNIRSQHISLSRQRIDNRLSLFLALGGDSFLYSSMVSENKRFPLVIFFREVQLLSSSLQM